MATDSQHLVTQLQRAGLRPSDQQMQTIVEAGAQALPDLIELATNGQVAVGAEPAAFGPIHALRLLGEFASLEPATITRLLTTLPLPETTTNVQAPYVWRQDLPQIIARSGSVSIEPARAILQDTSANREQRAAAAESLSYIPAVDDALRGEMIALLREQINVETDPYVAAYIATGLANLGASEAYSDIMAAFKRRGIDKGVISAADMRQRLLTSGTKRLECARHTLAERYDQHGPYTEEQRNQMAEYLRQQM